MLDENLDHSKSNGEDIVSMNEDIETYEKTFVSMLSQSNDSQEKQQNSSFTYLKEEKSNHNEDLSKSEKSQSVQNKDDDLLETKNKTFSKDQNPSEVKEITSSLHDHLFDNSGEISPIKDEFAIIRL